jgi:hypothetical protein
LSSDEENLLTVAGETSITPGPTERQQPARTTRTRAKSRTLADAQAAFLQAYPEFETTRRLDELRATEYARLDRTGHIYLDYTGGGLYAECQLSAHLDLLRQGVYGNPHSTNPTSMAMTHLVERARAYVLEFFNALPAEYEVIFTPRTPAAPSSWWANRTLLSPAISTCLPLTITTRSTAFASLPAPGAHA